MGNHGIWVHPEEKGVKCEFNQRHSHTFTVWSTLPVTTYGAVLWKSARKEKLTLRTNPELSYFPLSLNVIAFSKTRYQLKDWISKLVMSVVLKANSLTLYFCKAWKSTFSSVVKQFSQKRNPGESCNREESKTSQTDRTLCYHQKTELHVVMQEVVTRIRSQETWRFAVGNTGCELVFKKIKNKKLSGLFLRRSQNISYIQISFGLGQTTVLGSSTTRNQKTLLCRKGSAKQSANWSSQSVLTV